MTGWYHEQRGQYHTLLDREDSDAVSAAITAAAVAVKEADYLLITTGAGMGCDSGVPDFRGGQSFWDGLDHPEIKKYEDMSDDSWFEKDPELAWGLNMHQIKTFREATPHVGYEILRQLCDLKGEGKWFSWTSNVDGMFLAAGFDLLRIFECHGQIHRLQCIRGRSCGKPADLTLREDFAWNSSEEAKKPKWVADDIVVDIPYGPDYRALPMCPRCGSLARPNLWYCADKNYTPHPQGLENSTRYQEWRAEIAKGQGRVVVIECGGGTVIPSTRCEGEIFLEESQADGAEFKCTLIRINPTEFGVPEGGIGLPFGAAEGLQLIEAAMAKS